MKYAKDFFESTKVRYKGADGRWFVKWDYIDGPVGKVARVWTDWKGPFRTQSEAARAIYYVYNVE